MRSGRRAWRAHFSMPVRDDARWNAGGDEPAAEVAVFGRRNTSFAAPSGDDAAIPGAEARAGLPVTPRQRVGRPRPLAVARRRSPTSISSRAFHVDEHRALCFTRVILLKSFICFIA